MRHISRRAVVKITVKSFLKAGHRPGLDQRPGNMRPARRLAAGEREDLRGLDLDRLLEAATGKAGTREERRKLNRLAGERTITSVVRELIRNATPSDGLTRGETGANVPTTTRGE